MVFGHYEQFFMKELRKDSSKVTFLCSMRELFFNEDVIAFFKYK